MSKVTFALLTFSIINDEEISFLVWIKNAYESSPKNSLVLSSDKFHIMSNMNESYYHPLTYKMDFMSFVAAEDPKQSKKLKHVLKGAIKKISWTHCLVWGSDDFLYAILEVNKNGLSIEDFTTYLNMLADISRKRYSTEALDATLITDTISTSETTTIDYYCNLINSPSILDLMRSIQYKHLHGEDRDVEESWNDENAPYDDKEQL